MFDLFRLWLGAVLRGFRTRRSLMLENVALRQQLAVFKRQQPRPRLGAMDRLFWVVARRFWAQWKKALVIVLPDTVVRWHRSGFKLYWAMLCKVRKPVGGGRRISYGQKTHLRLQGRGVYPTEGSCRFPLIVLQQTTQPFLATHDSVIPARPSIRQGEQQPVLLALVIALLVVMCHVLLQGSAMWFFILFAIVHVYLVFYHD
jgi:hypothetical protein